MEKEWYDVEQLMEEQINENLKFVKGEIDNRNDFHSYRLLNEGRVEDSGIVTHNAIGEGAKTVAYTLKYLINNRLPDSIESLKIADFGGGAGFVANEIQKLLNCDKVYSYELAEEATKYGRNHFPKVNFINRGLKENDILDEGPFDVIIANEFYPFTRTSNYKYQRAYIEMCLSNLKKGGMLVIGLTENGTSLLDNYDALSKEYKGYKPRKMMKPYTKILQICGNNVRFASMVSKILKGKKSQQVMICMNYN